jgi:hypothetical protein
MTTPQYGVEREIKMNSKSLSRKRVVQVVTIACLTVLTGVAIGGTWRSSFPELTTTDQGDIKSPMGQVLRKKREIAKHRDLSFSIDINGVQPRDVVNIRPTEKSDVEGTAGTVITTDMAKARPGEQLPDAALDISDNSLTFNRPAFPEGSVFLDVQVPRALRVQVTFDGMTILSASVREPVSFRGKQIGTGSSSVAETVAQTLLPQGIKRDQAAPSLADGKLFVPFSQLHLVKQVAVGGLLGAVLEIDGTGQVVNVKPLTGSMTAEAEEKLRKWEFTPYQQGGRAVSVITVITPKDQ